MTITPWEDSTKKGKVLRIFPTDKVTKSGPWSKTFKDAVNEFNKLSKKYSLNVTFSPPPDPKATMPDPKTAAGAEVQFDLGNGTLSWEAFGNKSEEKNFDPTGTHGSTHQTIVVSGSSSRIYRAFVFVPEKPMARAMKRVRPGRDGFDPTPRPVGSGIRLFIAVHELIHACGLSDDEHTAGPGADVFAWPSLQAGDFDKPEDDKLMLFDDGRKITYGVPIFIGKPVAEMISNNWK